MLRFNAHYTVVFWLNAYEHFTPTAFTFMVKKIITP